MNKDFGKLIIIAGPTAVGKSSAAVRLAREIGGEIISADSMQTYRGMDIGTAKVTAAEMQGVPHYLIDIIDPDTDFNAAMFQKYAREACSRIYANGRIPIVCGGTGFYIQALLYDIDFSEETDRDDDYRRMLQSIASGEDGTEKLADMLKDIDPLAAENIDMHNPKRLIRALEYHKLHGSSIVLHNLEESKKREHSPYDYRFFVLTADRESLYERINQRVDKMMSGGLLDEARRLYDMKLRRDCTALQGIGYKELFEYFDGNISLDEAAELIKLNSRRYAKRQLTWFRREKNVIWIDTGKGDPIDEIRKYL